MQRALQDVLLRELSACSSAEQETSISFAKKVLQHGRDRWVYVDLMLAALGLWVIVNLAPPSFLTDIDRSAVWGNALDVDPQGFTKSQSCRRSLTLRNVAIRRLSPLSPFADIGIMSSFADIGNRGESMRIRTPIDLGALIRERRKALRLDQKTLAEKVGVSRQWVVDVEQGKPRLEIGLVLRTADALGIVLTVDKPTKGTSLAQPVILDSIVDAARKRRK